MLFFLEAVELVEAAVVCDNALYLGGTGMDKHAFSLTTYPDGICDDTCDDIVKEIGTDIFGIEKHTFHSTTHP